MPIYEYHCHSCGADFELFLRGDATPACPGCQGREIERHMSVPARPAGAKAPLNVANLGPPKTGGCCGGGCGCH